MMAETEKRYVFAEHQSARLSVQHQNDEIISMSG